jgi:hypothetical protein
MRSLCCVCVCVCPLNQFLSNVYHSTRAHLNSMLHKPLPSVIPTLQTLKLLSILIRGQWHLKAGIVEPEETAATGHHPVAMDTHATICELLEAMFPMQSMLRPTLTWSWHKAETSFQPWAVHRSIPGRSVCHKGKHGWESGQEHLYSLR